MQRTPKHPDFKHKESGKGLWIGTKSPQWAVDVLPSLNFKGGQLWYEISGDPAVMINMCSSVVSPSVYICSALFYFVWKECFVGAA
jgi:hypothetical protein